MAGPVYCEDCQHATCRDMLPDMWRCKDTPISNIPKTFVRRITSKDLCRCEEVNKDGKCLRILFIGDSLEDYPQGGWDV